MTEESLLMRQGIEEEEKKQFSPLLQDLPFPCGAKNVPAAEKAPFFTEGLSEGIQWPEGDLEASAISCFYSLPFRCTGLFGEVKKVSPRYQHACLIVLLYLMGG